ncbi:MAG: GNAT family N-acetyltransferase [Acidobacteria bacterium]|nr:GNAT family N-acetyltransferase [Acidobacteriota bacterium]
MFVRQVRDGVELRALRPEHAPEIFALADAERQRLRTWLPWVDCTHAVADVESFIRDSVDREARREALTLGIWAHGSYAGGIGFHKFDWANSNTSLGYWIASTHEGRGLVSGACRICVEHAFNTLGLHRIEIRCGTGNHRSRVIPRRLGFKLEGTLREAQRLWYGFIDLEVYSLLRSDPRLPG